MLIVKMSRKLAVISLDFRVKTKRREVEKGSRIGVFKFRSFTIK